MHPEAETLRCAIIRGGTSRGVYFLENDLPADPAVREKVLLRVFGSPDIRQIDGLGGATSQTSKTMIIRPSTRPDAHVDYTFGQVSVRTPVIDWGGNCGNLTSAIAPFAIDMGLVNVTEPVTEVRIFNTNTQKLIIARVPVKNGRALSEGDYAIPGVPGTGAKIELEFTDPAGSITGRLLPTGRPTDALVLDDGRRFTVSIVDASNPVVFMLAEELGLAGTELPPEIDARTDVLETMEQVRSQVCEILGIVDDRSQATYRSPGLPKIGMVAPPKDYLSSTGETVEAGEMTVLARLLSVQRAHGAYMVTGAVCTGAAAVVPGTVVHEVSTPPRPKDDGTDVVLIGHPFGAMDVAVRHHQDDGQTVVDGVTVGRTARRIMDGYVYVPRGCFTANGG